MARRRYRRKKYKKKNEGIEEGIILSFGALLFLYLSLRSGLDTLDMSSVIFNLVIGLAVPTLLVVGFLILKKRYFEKLARLKLYKENKSIEEVLSLHPRVAEEYVAGVYEQMGYSVDQVTQYSGDHGIDVILKKDKKKYAVQVKRYARHNYVKEKEVRDFYGSYVGDGYSGGMFVTTSSFTKPAIAWGGSRAGLELIDGPSLAKLVNIYK